MFGKGYRVLQPGGGGLGEIREHMEVPNSYEVRLYSSDRSFKKEVKKEGTEAAQNFLQDYELQEKTRKDPSVICWNLGIFPLYVFRGEDILHIRGSEQSLADALWAAKQSGK